MAPIAAHCPTVQRRFPRGIGLGGLFSRRSGNGDRAGSEQQQQLQRLPRWLPWPGRCWCCRRRGACAPNRAAPIADRSLLHTSADHGAAGARGERRCTAATAVAAAATATPVARFCAWPGGRPFCQRGRRSWGRAICSHALTAQLPGQYGQHSQSALRKRIGSPREQLRFCWPCRSRGSQHFRNSGGAARPCGLRRCRRRGCTLRFTSWSHVLWWRCAPTVTISIGKQSATCCSAFPRRAADQWLLFPTGSAGSSSSSQQQRKRRVRNESGGGSRRLLWSHRPCERRRPDVGGQRAKVFAQQPSRAPPILWAATSGKRVVHACGVSGCTCAGLPRRILVDRSVLRPRWRFLSPSCRSTYGSAALHRERDLRGDTQ